MIYIYILTRVALINSFYLNINPTDIESFSEAFRIVQQSYHNAHGLPARTAMIYSTANFSGHYEQEGIFSRAFSAITVPRFYRIHIGDDGTLQFNFRPDNHVESLWLKQQSAGHEITCLEKLQAAAEHYDAFPLSSFRPSGQAADDVGGTSGAVN